MVQKFYSRLRFLSLVNCRIWMEVYLIFVRKISLNNKYVIVYPNELCEIDLTKNRSISDGENQSDYGMNAI